MTIKIKNKQAVAFSQYKHEEAETTSTLQWTERKSDLEGWKHSN